MKKAFTLIELIIVIAVLVTLMGLVFRLGNAGGESWRKTLTVTRLQKLENCLSGYNAAYGSYPPVKLHGSRDVYFAVDAHGIQRDERNESIWNWNPETFAKWLESGESRYYQLAEAAAWEQVKAACKAQPVDCRFPFPKGYATAVEAVSRQMANYANSGKEHFKKYWENPAVKARLSSGFDDGITNNPGRHNANKNKKDWKNIQLFKFGLMSYLLPRYLVMMQCDNDSIFDFAQWTGNNTMPSDPFTGRSFSSQGGWDKIGELSRSTRRTDLAKVANMPSQAICARWMPNLKGMCTANYSYSLFGVDIRDEVWPSGELSGDNPYLDIFSPSGDSTSSQYILDGVSVVDGWGHAFYYYSPAPYQRYTLWSAGSNNRTFPPWISRKALSSAANKCVGVWTKDDIVHLSN